MSKEYVVLTISEDCVLEQMKQMGLKYAEIKSTVHEKLSYYVVDVSFEKAKEIYTKGAEVMGKISELPYIFNSFKHRPTEAFAEFKKRFGESLDNLLTKENLPQTNAMKHRVLLCSSGSGPSVEELSKRDEFISSVYSALAKLSVSNA